MHSVHDILKKRKGPIVAAAGAHFVLYLNVLRGTPAAESLGTLLSLLVSAVLGVALGAGADSKHAVGVGWRIGLAWFLLSGLIEYPIGPQWSSGYTADHFVGIFLGHALVVGLAFRLRKPIISANASGTWTIRDWLVLVGTVAAVITVMVAVLGPKQAIIEF